LSYQWSTPIKFDEDFTSKFVDPVLQGFAECRKAGLLKQEKLQQSK
jgi:hypothetical protein